MTDFILVMANKNYSSWSIRAWLVMVQTGMPFEEIVIPLDRPDTADAIAARSSSGLLPILKHGSNVVWDSLAITEDLAERFPGAGIWPNETAPRAVARSVVAEMHSGFRDLRSQLPMNVRASKPGHARTPETDADIRRITAIWGDCRSRFGGGGPYLFGPWTAADAFYAPVVSRFATYGVPLGEPAAAYAEAVRSHPAVLGWFSAAAEEPWAISKYDAI